ncbi:MAG TPA: hypothetical protein VNO70_25380 [Blastocatellia bacterium]|nr:hypothetical protein [Blastocatellia bacterium]
MSYRMKMILPIIGMVLVIGYAAIRVVSSNVQEVEQPLPPALNNLADAKLIEIKDAGGQVVLSGNFVLITTVGDETERVATLTAAGSDPDARGIAEIEITQTNNAVAEQELELTVEQLTAGAAFRVFVDNQEAASFTANHQGVAEVEFSSALSK